MENGKLTERQLEVLVAYLTHGGARAAAEALGLHYRTVYDHLRVCREKLGASSIADLGVAATNAGVVTIAVTQ